jgi:hypothetical protein
VSQGLRVPIALESETAVQSPLRVWRLTQMSVSGFRSSPRAVHASSLASLASLALPQPSLCHWVPMIAELCTHRFESLVVLGVVETRQRPFASVSLEGNECDRVPIALASETAVHSPLRVCGAQRR